MFKFDKFRIISKYILHMKKLPLHLHNEPDRCSCVELEHIGVKITGVCPVIFQNKSGVPRKALKKDGICK